jgi:hypothetical protein
MVLLATIVDFPFLELQAHLLNKLSEISPERLPAVTFTCVGPIVKFWLAE